MPLSAYLDQKRRTKIKKDLRKTKPYLMGWKLDEEVDRVMGVIDSGELDWVQHTATKADPNSTHPTPDSVTKQDVYDMADKYSLRPYVVYWSYKQKVAGLEASGRTKTNYLSLLEQAAQKAKPVVDSDEKIKALTVYFSEVLEREVTRSELEIMILEGKV